jgi:hypothetical protein
MKTGPAAPVTWSPQRSMRLQQVKTKLGREKGMTPACSANNSEVVTCSSRNARLEALRGLRSAELVENLTTVAAT